MVNGGDVLARGVVDILLALCHAVDILAQGGELFLRRGIEQQQVLQRLLAAQPVRPGNAEADGAAEVLVEFFVALAVVAQQLFEVGAELLLQAVPDDLELTVVLQQLARDVQAQVGGVHHAAHEAQIIRQQRVAVIHDHHARGVELQALFIFLCVVIKRRVFGYKQQCGIGCLTLGFGVYNAGGVVVIIELFFIEIVVILGLYFTFLLFPKRNHAVEGAYFSNVLVFGGLILLALLFRHGLFGCKLHTDRVANVIGILLYKRAYSVLVEELIVIIVPLVFLYVQGYSGARRFLFAGLDRVAVRSR